MLKNRLNIFFSLLLALNSFVYSQNEIYSFEGKDYILKNWVIAKDPNPRGKLLNPPEESWRTIQDVNRNEEYDTGNWLIKTDLTIHDSIDANNLPGLFIPNLLSAYEIYWDGKFIYRNGELGTDRESEVPGNFAFNVSLEKEIASKGKHTILIRLSNHRNDSPWKWYNSQVIISHFESGLAGWFKSFFQPVLFMGLVFIPFLFNLFLYFARNKKPEHLLFSIICFLVFLDSATASVPAFFNLPSTYIHIQYYLYTVITLLFSILLPLFFVYFFSLSLKLTVPIFLINILVMTVTLLFTENKIIFSAMSVTLLLVSTVLVVWSAAKKKEDSLLILFGVSAGWFAYFFNIAFTGLGTIMVICVSFSVARQYAKSERRESEAKLKSAHLENELLKKNINPHFMLNTLTSIIAWLRKEPESAVKLVEALAQEFRMINQISSLKTIAMRQEVELCKTHLQIMNYRKKARYELVTVGLTDDELIPPMIFHTLIENGLTHGFENKNEGTFTLKRTQTGKGILYTLTNDGEFIEEEQRASTGVGLNYIKGRLEESYPGRWEISSGKNEMGWENSIFIRNE